MTRPYGAIEARAGSASNAGAVVCGGGNAPAERNGEEPRLLQRVIQAPRAGANGGQRDNSTRRVVRAADGLRVRSAGSRNTTVALSLRDQRADAEFKSSRSAGGGRPIPAPRRHKNNHRNVG